MKKVALFAVFALVAFSAQADIDNLDIGGDLMAEYFFANEVAGMDSETDFLRTEGHVWLQADLDDNVTARISVEFDRALDQSQAGATNFLGANGNGNLDLFLEEAVVSIADIAGSGFSVSVGRQFVNFGDDPNADDFNGYWGPGFILSDGAPGSPASLLDLGGYEIDPFDAIVASYDMESAVISAVYARAMEDFSSVVNNDSAVTALYASFYGIEGHQIDLYGVWTDDNAGTTDEYIIGARAAGDINEDVAYKLEVAYQTQDNDTAGGVEVDALAIDAGINYHPDLDNNPEVGFIWTYLEGDNGSGFTAIDGKTYGLVADGMMMGEMTNAMIFNLNGGFEPMEDVAWTADLFYILLDDDIAGEDDGGFEIDTQVDYQFNDNLMTFVGAGVYFIGDAFGRDDEAYFFRTGMKVNF